MRFLHKLPPPCVMKPRECSGAKLISFSPQKNFSKRPCGPRVSLPSYLEIPLTECVLGFMVGPAAAARATVVVGPPPPGDAEETRCLAIQKPRI